MKNFYFLFAVGLLACAGTREIDIWDDDPGSPVMIWLGDNTDLPLESQINLPTDSSLTWIDKTICGGGAALGSERGEFIIAAPVFDIRVTITFPRMTLQQAAELEARVRKLFPEAQEIDFGLEKKIEAPAENFYYDMPDGVEFRILPGLTFPLQDLKNGNILKADSTGTPAWKVF